MKKNDKDYNRIVIALLALAFALMAIVAMYLGDKFMAKLFGVLALLCFGAKGIEIFKGLH